MKPGPGRILSWLLNGRRRCCRIARGLRPGTLAIPLCAALLSDPAAANPLLRQGLDAVFPAARVEVGSIELRGIGSARIENVRMLDRDSGRLLGVVREIEMRFDPHAMLRREITEIRIVHPILHITPGLFHAMGARESGAAQAAEKSDGGWLIRRLHCDFGEIYAAGISDPALFVSARFAFDFRDFGTAPDAAATVHSLDLWSVSVSTNSDYSRPFLSLDLVQTNFSPAGIRDRREIDAVASRGGNLLLGDEALALAGSHPAADPPPEASPAPPAAPLTVAELTIQGLQTRLEGSLPGGEGTTFTIQTELRNIPLGDLASTVGREQQTVELANVELLSPIDPLVRVVTLHSVFAYFTLEGIARRQIARLIILNPTLYLSEDLFLYMERMRGQEQGEHAEQEGGGWSIDELRIEFGRLVLGGERAGRVGLPLSFQTAARDVSFDNLASLRLDASLEILPQSFEFPPLQLELEELRGDLRFAYPPQQDPDNLVNVLHLDSVRWRQFEAAQLWLSATFERAGISATMGGEAYGGYVNAGLNFAFGGDSRWIGWVAGTGIDLKALTDILAPQNFRLTGAARFALTVDAAGSRIDRLVGDLSSDQPGILTISKLDDLIAGIPDDWSLLKQTGTQAALEALRDFSYTSAGADFWFAHGHGKLTLRLPGAAGSRNLDVFLHADEASEGRWKNPATTATTP